MTDYTDLIERLRRPTITPSVLTCREAADALAALVKERDFSCLKDGSPWHCVSYVVVSQERDVALARVKRLEDVLLKINDRHIYKQRGSTHWDGCEASHPECAMAREIEAALAEGDGCMVCGSPAGHSGLPCPKLKVTAED